MEALLGSYIRISKILHLHSSQPITKGAAYESSDDEVVQVEESAYSRKRPATSSMQVTPKAQQAVVELLDSDSDDDEIEILEDVAPKKARAT